MALDYYFSNNILNYFCSKIENLNSIIKQNSDIITEQEKQITSLQQELGAEKTSDIGKHIIETSQVGNINIFYFLTVNRGTNSFILDF